MATAITTTPQDITGDFDLVVRQTAAPGGTVTLQKSLGSATTNWVTMETLLSGCQPMFVRNSGTNSYRLVADTAGVACEFEQ